MQPPQRCIIQTKFSVRCTDYYNPPIPRSIIGTAYHGHELGDDQLVCDGTSNLTRRYAAPKQGIDLVDEDHTGGEPSSEGEQSPNQFLSSTYVQNEVEHVKLAVTG